jgi:hypothetical protein
MGGVGKVAVLRMTVSIPSAIEVPKSTRLEGGQFLEVGFNVIDLEIYWS